MEPLRRNGARAAAVYSTRRYGALERRFETHRRVTGKSRKTIGESEKIRTFGSRTRESRSPHSARVSSAEASTRSSPEEATSAAGMRQRIGIASPASGKGAIPITCAHGRTLGLADATRHQRGPNLRAGVAEAAMVTPGVKPSSFSGSRSPAVNRSYRLHDTRHEDGKGGRLEKRQVIAGDASDL